MATLLVGAPIGAAAQTFSPTLGRVSFHLSTATHDLPGEGSWSDTELWTGINFHTPDDSDSRWEFGYDLRHSGYPGGNRTQRFSMYDGYAGVRIGKGRQVRLRAGHMWVPELGSIGALAGGLAELRLAGTPDSTRFRAALFTGLEPALYSTGYATGVRKHGGYVALEKGFLRRHVLGYTLIRQGPITERSVMTTTNIMPVGRSFFLYQAAEFDVQGPASGAGHGGLSYFLANGRFTASSRVELLGTYSRGRAVDARTLTEDLRSGRALTSQALDGLRYESAGGRITVEVVPQVHVYAGYARDRNNRDDLPSDRVTLGGHAGNAFGTGFDVSASGARIERPTGPYHSTYVSVGHSVGRSLYLSADYSTSLTVVRLLGSDGLVIETRPSMHRVSVTGSFTVVRDISLLCTLERSRDDASNELRLLTGLSFRLR